MNEFEGVDLTGFLNRKRSVVVVFCPKTDRINVDLLPVCKEVWIEKFELKVALGTSNLDCKTVPYFCDEHERAWYLNERSGVGLGRV